MVTVKAVVITTGDKCVILHAHITVTEVYVINAMDIVVMAVQRESTAINVNITVMKIVQEKFVDTAMGYVQTDVLIFIMERNVSPPVVLPVVPDIVTDITVPVLDVVTGIWVHFAETQLV
jgi:hypothetical protein